ncbi:hypothetical protein Q0590_29355 [Rhodocytophaga aerolata]|uniref:Quercetin 2,3-dioxygenase C-terminal cupin domain-containing protein n=1 Tax=Rhodocytophaga aerolata TaxID=455078 RepID=A0ABT8RGZ1_9BACT|nr:hypothetical protein [Rhodocytophaga aerolata]MDO1450418.1 hypothetical protein [Rhodocytophaga aerolata]
MQEVKLVVEEASYISILPITGQVNVIEPDATVTKLDVGEILILPVASQVTLPLTNPYEAEEITFLHVSIKTNEAAVSGHGQVVAFDLASLENQLFSLNSVCNTTAYPFAISLGRFDGRKEAFYPLKNQQSTLFAFVVNGAFELEGRLLHAKDGLALWNTPQIELEALSNQAIIVTVELMNEQR